MSGPARRRNALLLAPAVLLVGVLFGGGLVGAVRQSLEPPLGGGLSTWSLARWDDLLSDPAFGDAVVLSLRTTVLATLASALLALPVASVLRGRGTAVRALVALPVPVPHLVVATTAVLWLGPGGLAERALGSLPIDLVRDRAGLGIVVVYVYKETPFLVLLLLASMGRDLEQREEAAAVLGLAPLARLRHVVWPAVRAPLAAGSLVVAAFAFGAFEVPLAVGPNDPSTVATYALEATQGDALTGAGTAAAALLVAAAASMVAAVVVVRVGRSATPSGRVDHRDGG